MHRRAFLALPALALALSACGTTATTSAPTAAPQPAAAPTAAPAQPIEVSDVWSRPALGPDAMEAKPTGSAMEAKPTGSAMMGGGMTAEGPTGAVFMTLRNTGGAADRLIKAESMVAKVVELHNVIDNNGVMEMRPVENIEIPAGGTVLLKPGSFHVMLIGLQRELKLGESFEVTLHFQQAGAIKVSSTVRMPE